MTDFDINDTEPLLLNEDETNSDYALLEFTDEPIPPLDMTSFEESDFAKHVSMFEQNCQLMAENIEKWKAIKWTSLHKFVYTTKANGKFHP